MRLELKKTNVPDRKRLFSKEGSRAVCSFGSDQGLTFDLLANSTAHRITVGPRRRSTGVSGISGDDSSANDKPLQTLCVGSLVY